MSGRLKERDYYTVREGYESDQRSLDEWTDSDETLIAVVRKPRDTGIDEMCDEWWAELGMPEWALKKFWELREGYRMNSAVDDPHEKAYEDANLSAIYYKHLHNSEGAQKRVNELADRLDAGENIVLVCFEQGDDSCHRHMLLDVVERRRSCQFSLSP